MAILSPFSIAGDIQPVGFGQQGIFHNETRHLSRLEMLFCGFRPLLLSSTIREDNVLFGIDLTNPDIQLESGASLPRGTVHIYRTKFLTELVCYDQVTVNNYGDTAIDIELSFEFESDFADIFEVRGEKRKRRGEKLPQEIGRSSVTLAYEGLDQIRRTTHRAQRLPVNRTTAAFRFRFKSKPMAKQASRSMLRASTRDIAK